MTVTDARVLIVGGMNRLAGSVAEVFTQKGAKTSFAFETGEGERVIEYVSEQGFTPERMRAVDFSSPDILQTQLASFEPIDTAIYIPRWFKEGRFMDSADDLVGQALHANVAEAIYALQALSRVFIKQGRGGRIIVLSGLVGRAAVADMLLLGTTLAALHAVCDKLALELCEHGITLNRILTDDHPSLWTFEDSARVARDVPLGQMPSPEDVARACCFLASPEARGMTGVSLALDGGFTLKHHP